MMADSNGCQELDEPPQAAGCCPGTWSLEAPTSAAPPPPAPGNRSATKRKRRRASGEASLRETPASRSGVGVAGVAGTRPQQVPSLSRVSLETVLDVEMKLVYGDEQSSQQLCETLTSSGAMVKCQSGGRVSSTSGSNALQIDPWLWAALRNADACYRLRKYALAATRFTAALQLCSRGAVFGELVSADHEDVVKVTSFIESRLAACYLRMKRPATALQHSLRSIHLNPIHFRNHLQQAMEYRLLNKPCKAVRSAMIADYVHWLSGDGEPHISKLIKLYWQGLLEDAITMEEGFSVLYTPCFGEPTRATTLQAENTFRKLHPAFSAYIFTDTCGGHVLPQTTDWSAPSSQRYILTLGFRRRPDGDFLDKLLHRKWPTFTGPPASVVTPACRSEPNVCEALGRRILPVLEFIACTKLAVGFYPGSGLIERLQYADCLLQLRRGSEHTQELQHVLAELALAPYLQELSHTDTGLLQALMADITDTLEGKTADRERVWNTMQKVGLIEDTIYKLEETYLKNKALRATRKQKAALRKSLKEATSFTSKEQLPRPSVPGPAPCP